MFQRERVLKTWGFLICDLKTHHSLSMRLRPELSLGQCLGRYWMVLVMRVGRGGGCDLFLSLKMLCSEHWARYGNDINSDANMLAKYFMTLSTFMPNYLLPGFNSFLVWGISSWVHVITEWIWQKDKCQSVGRKGRSLRLPWSTSICSKLNVTRKRRTKCFWWCKED